MVRFRGPVVLQAVSVYVVPHVLYSVIHNLVGIFTSQSFVGEKEIGIERGTRFHVLSDFALDRVSSCGSE